MRSLTRRIAALESTTTGGVDLAVRQWLGMELSAAEQEKLDALPAEEPMTREEVEQFDSWWHDPLRPAWPI